VCRWDVRFRASSRSVRRDVRAPTFSTQLSMLDSFQNALSLRESRGVRSLRILGFDLKFGCRRVNGEVLPTSSSVCSEPFVAQATHFENPFFLRADSGWRSLRRDLAQLRCDYCNPRFMMDFVFIKSPEVRIFPRHQIVVSSETVLWAICRNLAGLSKPEYPSSSRSLSLVGSRPRLSAPARAKCESAC